MAFRIDTRALRGLIPAGAVISEPDEFERYATDASYAGRFPPDAVVLPANTGEVAAVLAYASANGIPVTPRGAGTGQSGGALAVHGGIVLSLERMARLREIDRGDLVAVAEPGIILGELQRAVEAEGLFYPPDPASLDMCTLGGNVAENAGGPRAVKYGVTRDYVIGLEAVLPSGEVIRTGRRTHKGVSGYDVTGLIVGSEGTLAVITEVTVALLPRPRRVETGLLVFSSLDAAARAVSEVVKAGITPRTAELIDHVAIAHVRPKVPHATFPETAQAALLIETDGADDAAIEEISRIADCAARTGALDVLIAQGEAQRANLWKARRMISSALAEAHPFKVAEDVVVPLSRLSELITRFHGIATQHGLAACAFGHAGDGNLHLNFLFDDAAAAPRAHAAVRELFRATLELRGTVSGEHGIGVTKREFLAWEQGARVIDLQRSLKRLADPFGILNPGKVLP